MADAPTQAEPVFVDPNTDDLDAFSDLMSGRAKVKTEEAAPVEEDEPSETDEDVENVGEENDEDGTEGDPEDESPDEDDESEEEPEKPTKKVNRFQERINELTARAREAERREADTARRIAELEAKQVNPPADTGKQPAPTVQDVGPTPDDKNDDGSDKYPLGEFDPTYIRDLTRHTIQTEQAAANQKAEQERTQREAQASRDALQEQWSERATAVVEKHPDFVERTMELETTFEGLDPGYSDYLVQTIKSLDHGPEVLYHFANNLAEAQKFVKLGPLAATLALGEMNARFRAPPAEQAPKPEPKVSKAPTPPPANKGSKTRTTVAADTDDLDAFADIFFAKRKPRS